MYYLQCLGAQVKSIRLIKMFFVVVNVAHCQQVGISWIQASGLNKQMKRISAHRLYYVIVKLVCKADSGVTWRRISKTFSEIATKRSKYGVNLP